MSSKIKKYVIPSIVGIIIGCTLAMVALYRLTPPLSSEYENLQKEMYAYYMVHKAIPTDDSFMSSASKKLLEEHPDRIMWDADEQTLSYRYEKPYPWNISLLSILTAGYIVPGPQSSGESTGPDLIPSNAELYHKNGMLEKQMSEAEKR